MWAYGAIRPVSLHAAPERSSECAIAARPGYQDLHAECRQIIDAPLPFTIGVLPQHRCGCPRHAYNCETR